MAAWINGHNETPDYLNVSLYDITYDPQSLFNYRQQKMNKDLERLLEGRFDSLYGKPASARIVENQDPENKADYPLTVLIRFPVSTPEKFINPHGEWYEIRHDLGPDHAAGLLSGIPEKVSHEIENLMAAARANWDDLKYKIGRKITPPHRVDGPHEG